MQKKSIKNSLLTLIVLLLIFSSFTVCVKGSTNFHAIKGTLYIDNEVAEPGVEIQLDVPEKSFTTIVETTEPDINGYNFYAGFDDSYTGTTVYFTIQYQGESYLPLVNKSIILNKNTEPIEEYILDLYVVTDGNSPPNKPFNPNPANNSKNIGINPPIGVTVTDPDDDQMNVSFYNASNDQLIGTANNIANGSTASVTWNDLAYNTSYSWYAIANDSQFVTKSDTWVFTTKEQENNPPTVKIIKPKKKTLYIRNNELLPNFLLLTLIIGDITIEVNATDDDSGIEKVEFYITDLKNICGKLVGNDTSEPYTYNWTKDKTRLIHLFGIKVIAYDNEGLTAEDKMFVRKFL